MSFSVADLAGHYHQAWAVHDTDAIAALHTQDSVFHIHGATEPAVGRPSVRELVATFLELVPNLRFASKRAYFSADHIVFEYDMSGTLNGADFTCDGVDVIGVRDGLVARKDSYIDLRTLVNQTGELPDLARRRPISD